MVVILTLGFVIGFGEQGALSQVPRVSPFVVTPFVCLLLLTAVLSVITGHSTSCLCLRISCHALRGIT